MQRNFIKNRKLAQNANLAKLAPIASIDTIIEKRIDKKMAMLKDKYAVKESDLYDTLYLKVRKMFLEEAR